MIGGLSLRVTPALLDIDLTLKSVSAGATGSTKTMALIL